MQVYFWELCNLVTQQWLCNALYKRNPFSSNKKSRIFHYCYRLLIGLCQQSMPIHLKKAYPKFHCHAKSLFLCSLHRAVCNALLKSAKLYWSPQGNSTLETLYWRDFYFVRYMQHSNLNIFDRLLFKRRSIFQ